MSRKAAVIFAHKSRAMEIIIKFCAAEDPSLTGVTFAPTRAEALTIKAHLEGRGYVVDLPTRIVPRTHRSEEPANEQLRGTKESLVGKRSWSGLGSLRYRWLRGDGAWLPAC
jgi:hypothetical protein